MGTGSLWRWICLSLAFLLVLVGTSACGESQPRYPFFIQSLEGFEQFTPTTSKAELAEVIKTQIQQNQLPFELTEKQTSDTSTIELRWEYGENHQLFLYATLKPSKKLQSEVKAEVMDANVFVDRTSQTYSLKEDIGFAIEQAFVIFATKMALARGEQKDLATMLQASQSETVLLALDWFAEQPRPGYEDLLVNLLEHANDEIVQKAILCLGLVGDSRHAAQLVKKVHLLTPMHMLAVYQTLGKLGGPEAQGFLQFAAQNEDEPSLRAAAQQALVASQDKLSSPTQLSWKTTSQLPRGHRP